MACGCSGCGGDQQEINVSAGGSDYTWPATVYATDGTNITTSALTVALVEVGATPVSYVAPDTLIHGSMTVAAYRALYPADVLSPGLADGDLIYFATAQVFIDDAEWPAPPYNLKLWLDLDRGAVQVITEADFGISVR